MRIKGKSGITLIALIITIIVLLILAGVSLNVLTGDNGIITNAQTASVKTRFASYNEELGMYAMDDMGIYASGNGLKTYIKSMQDQDIDKFVIIKSKLLYIGSDEMESSVAQSMGFGGGSGDSSNSAAVVTEVQAIMGNVLDLGSTYTPPVNDSEEATITNNSQTGLIGIRLYTRNSSNIANGKWNIIDDYNSQNVKTARYESGYYWLKKGETYTIDEEAITFANDYVVNYATKEFILLSDRMVNWNTDATLAVSGAALNLDPAVFAEGEWRHNGTNPVKTYEQELAAANAIEDADQKASALATINGTFYNFYTKSLTMVNNIATESWIDTGIQKTGDVVYNSTSNALELNEHNEDGKGGYLKLERTGLNFTNGFTFEMYINLDNLGYNAGNGGIATGFFCRKQTLSTNKDDDFNYSLRFGYFNLESENNKVIGKVNRNSSWTGAGLNMGTGTTGLSGNWNVSTLGYEAGQNVYITFSYLPYNKNVLNNEYDDYMKENEVDKVFYYINGELYGYTYNGHDSFVAGLSNWNNDNCLFFVGVCPWENASVINNNFLQGKIYTVRLYQNPLTSIQVKDNYDMTLKYRSSF